MDKIRYLPCMTAEVPIVILAAAGVMAGFVHFVFELYPLTLFMVRNPASSFAIEAEGSILFRKPGLFPAM